VNAADSENRFFTLWTMKEAYIKAEGGVLSDAAGLSLVSGGRLEAKLLGYHFETEKTDSYYLTVCYK
jgi:phosphopantetheinyl transferase